MFVFIALTHIDMLDRQKMCIENKITIQTCCAVVEYNGRDAYNHHLFYMLSSKNIIKIHIIT